jgi:hypothetical protein
MAGTQGGGDASRDGPHRGRRAERGGGTRTPGLGAVGDGAATARVAALSVARNNHITPLSAADQMHYATTVATRLPESFAALAAGRIHPVHLRIIEDETSVLGDQDAATADKHLAEAAAGMTFGELRSAAHKLVLKLDPKRPANARKPRNGRPMFACSGRDQATPAWSPASFPSRRPIAPLTSLHRTGSHVARPTPTPTPAPVDRVDPAVAAGAVLVPLPTRVRRPGRAWPRWPPSPSPGPPSRAVPRHPARPTGSAY